jgi:hypothetical protein
MEIKTREDFLALSDLDKVKYVVEESLESHKGFDSEYWKGSAYMGECVLETIEHIKNNF